MANMNIHYNIKQNSNQVENLQRLGELSHGRAR